MPPLTYKASASRLLPGVTRGQFAYYIARAREELRAQRCNGANFYIRRLHSWAANDKHLQAVQRLNMRLFRLVNEGRCKK
jgi:hypothetical protein